ncbi:uncharacterized protein LOC131641038 isoform X2 [Vicia villosa]|uniref:uncharacterized protein LOC131641037 isoform X2 n=1 Tax=Vicia villosa TaxID=3911 RepID=UPI00273CB8A2|nr:uncharacterized protein LOC131641037 isoform X2 [Vicia villosa]XP_058767346.1 uncharacterized protein LOC131641038 isoform X2 [Vicia villosa]
MKPDPSLDFSLPSVNNNRISSLGFSSISGFSLNRYIIISLSLSFLSFSLSVNKNNNRGTLIFRRPWNKNKSPAFAGFLLSLGFTVSLGEPITTNSDQGPWRSCNSGKLKFTATTILRAREELTYLRRGGVRRILC